MALAFGTVGALVAARRPGNAVGWVLVIGAVVLALTGFAEEWAIHTLFDAPGSLPGGIVMAWMTQWTFTPSLVQIPALLLLLFPDGRLPGRRWRPALWLAVATTVTLAVGSSLGPRLRRLRRSSRASPGPSASRAPAAAARRCRSPG